LLAVSKNKKKAGRATSSEEILLQFLEKHLSNDFPNQGRKGCPSNQALNKLVGPRRKVNPVIIRHLFRCSPCYRYYSRRLRQLSAKSAVRPRARRPKL
jgi:hypothetical protein